MVVCFYPCEPLARHQSTSFCSSGSSDTLAYAVTCQRDTYDRPTWARINFCPARLSTSASAWNIQLYTAIHEVRKVYASFERRRAVVTLE